MTNTETANEKPQYKYESELKQLRILNIYVNSAQILQEGIDNGYIGCALRTPILEEIKKISPKILSSTVELLKKITELADETTELLSEIDKKMRDNNTEEETKEFEKEFKEVMEARKDIFNKEIFETMDQYKLKEFIESNSKQLLKVINLIFNPLDNSEEVLKTKEFLLKLSN